MTKVLLPIERLGQAGDDAPAPDDAALSGVEITPEEVRNYFKKIPVADLPFFGVELEVAQIVVIPKVSDADKQKVIDKLNGFKKEIEEGSSFSTKAVLYSQDPGSKSNGGTYWLY